MKLDNKTKELIAIGASLTAGCQFCLQFHSGKARENGAEEEEIAMAIEIGRIVRRGAAAKIDDFAVGLKESVVSCSDAVEESKGCEI